MGLGPLLKSALKEATEKLPANIKAQSATPMLKKAGVKDEELTFSGVGQTISDAGTDKIAAADLTPPEGQFGEQVREGDETLYNWVSIDAGASNPTYKERVITFGEPGRYQSSHFPEGDGPSNYLMHNRVFDDVVDGKPTRVLQEIQSDLHQQGRQAGYRPELSVEDHNKIMDFVDNDDLEGASSFARTLGWTPDQGPLAEWVIDGGAPKSPWEKQWLKKGIELEIADAVKSGKEQLMIPIKGPQVGALQRAEGVQNWYEGTVVNTAKKIAKQYGGEVEMRSGGAPEHKFALSDSNELADIKGDIVGLARAMGKPIDEFTARDQQRIYEDFAAMHSVPMSQAVEMFDLALKKGTTDADIRALSVRDSLDQSLVIKFPVESTSVIPEGLRQRAREIDQLRMGEVKLTQEQQLLPADQRIAAHVAAIEEGRAVVKTKAAELQAELDILGLTERQLTQESNIAPKIKKPDFKLYASPTATVGALGLYAAGRDEGYSDEELLQFAESKGLSDDMRFVVDAKKEGYDDAQIQAYLNGPTEVQGEETELLDPAVDEKQLKFDMAKGGTAKQEAYAKITDPDYKMDMGELLASMKVVHPNMTSVTLRTSAFFGNEAAARQAETAVAAQAQQIVNLAQEKFDLNMTWDPQVGNFFVDLPHGKFEVTESFLDSIESEGGELIGAIAGGSLGGYLGSRSGNAWLTLGSSVLGAVGGSVVGTEIDYLREAMQLQVEMNADVAAHKALTAAEASVIGDVIGFGVFKGLGKGWGFVDSTYQAIKDGNSKGAVQAMKDVLFVSDSEAEEVVTRLNKSLIAPVEGNKAQQELRAVLATTQGSDIIIKAASQIDPLAGQATVKAIDDRAKDLNRAASALTDENVGRIIREDLGNYVADTKAFYQAVKDQAAASPYGNSFKFNFENLALNPALEAVKRNLLSRGDSNTLERFTLQAQRINGMSESRSFTDLIELRQLTNDFLFNKKITSAKDSKALFDVRDRIDAAIDVGAKVVLRDQADMWKANFTAAKSEYAKMKGLEKNVLSRVLNRPGVSEKAIVQGLTKYITAVDGTFTDIMAKLPKTTRFNTEGAVIDNLTEKFTAGMGDGLRATHFPLLDAELSKIAFTSPQARQYKALVHQYSEVFKNDVPLSMVSGQIQIPKFQSYLTADPVVRAKFEIASGVFNTIKTFAPGKEQRNLALVKNAAKLLETPLNSKAAADVMAELSADVDIGPQVVKLQQEAALAAMAKRDKEAVAIRLYGEGAVKAMKGAVESQKIPMHRIATQADAKSVADQDGILMSDTQSLDYALKQRGYAGILKGADKVRTL